MDIDNNSLSFYNLKKYEDHLNNSNKNVSDRKSKHRNGNKKKQREKNNLNVNDVSYQNNINNSNQSFVSFSDESSYLSSFCNNDIFDDNSDPLNGHGKLINNFPYNSDCSDNELSENAYYKEQKENYINNILNENKCNCYENEHYLQHNKTTEKKTHKTKNVQKKNRKNSFTFNNNINSIPLTQENNIDIKIARNVDNIDNKNSLYDKEDNNNVNNKISNNRNDSYDKNNCESNNDEDLYSVISGSEYDNEIIANTHKFNGCGNINNNSINKIAVENSIKLVEKTMNSNNMNLMKENKSIDELGHIQNNKNIKNIQKSVLTNFDVSKDKIKDNNLIIKNNYEFKELITSTINLCYPKIKNENDSEDILKNMEKLSKIVIADDKKKEILNNDEIENTNSLYDEVDNILDNRNKMYIEERNKFLLKKKEVANADNLDNKKIEEDTNKISNENLNSNKATCEKIRGTVENIEKENNNEKLDNFMYYLNHHMIELNENIYKLYNGTCDYTQRNYCTKNIINIVPHLNNIYENKNLCYIKDSPNFNEISKIIPAWKDSFEILNKKALKDTEDMKNILHRMENIKNDLDELNKDLKEDKKEFEKIKFETVEHESLISSFEKKSKIHIKGVLKLDNMSFKLKKIHNIPSNNLNNYTLSEHVNRLLKCIDNSVIDYSQNFNEKNFEILRFQNFDNKFDILTNTDEESCFIMNILNEELKEMILEKKERLQKIIRKTQLYNILDANTYKEHIGNTLNKHNIIINQIKNNIQNKVISLFDMYEKFFKKNIKIIKISDIHVKDYINENVKKSYIIKTFNDTKKNVEKYFMSINFTRNKPIDHPFFIYHCLSEKFVYHFIAFVLDPLSDQNQKNFMQYCSIPGFNSFLFSQQVIKLYRQEEQFTKSDISYDFSSAYSRIMYSDLYDFTHKQVMNNIKEKWNEENQYLIALRNASDDFFKLITSKNKYNNCFSLDSSNGFNLIQHIPDSLTHMCNNYTAICYDNFNNQGTVLGISKNEDINKTNFLSSFLNTSTSNTSNMLNNITSNNLFNQNKSNIFTNNTSNNLFNINNSTTTNNVLNNTSNLFSNNNSSNLFTKNVTANTSNNLFGNTTNNLFKNINNSSNILSNNTNNLFDQSKSNIFANNTSNNLFNINNNIATNNALNSSSNLFSNNNSSNLFTKNVTTNTSNNLFSNTTNNLFNNNSNKNTLFNNNNSISNISNNLQNNFTSPSSSSIFNKSNSTNFFSGSNNNTNGYFNKNSLNISNNLFNNDKNLNNTTSNIFSSFNLQTNTKPNNFANNSIFSTNLNNNSSLSLKDGMFSSTSGGNQFMNNNLFSSTKDLNRQSNNLFYPNNSNNNSMNTSNVNNNIYSAKYRCDNSNNNSLFNNNSIFNNQSTNFSGNNNSNLLSNNNSFSFNNKANVFSNNTLSFSNTNNLSKNNLFNVSSNNLSNNSNNIFSNNSNNNLFNSSNNISTNNIFSNNSGITNSSINNNLSLNNNSLFNSKNSLLSSNNNNNFSSNTSMLNNNSTFLSNNNILQNNNLCTNSLNNKSSSIFSKDNKTANNIFDNRLFQIQDNNYISNSKMDISGKNNFGISSNLSNNNLFQKNSFSVTQNKEGISNFNSSLPNNFNLINNMNPFQKKNEPNFPSFFNSTNNTLFSR
ncbi:conserved Plasmodium protein, unknown function [Plasmodium relictum]|uniref:Nucleoporin NUP205 n=1 Tax=Plasmodium relictum TaxID=85471 RepID=A0A1J1H7E8_PLARL|nr:conserved Plasmodium protein, unknown function [Plasmodium relictum]CRH00716.1 conserved Plasmodium protein, unknown function [Plasmodium relictum]